MGIEVARLEPVPQVKGGRFAIVPEGVTEGVKGDSFAIFLRGKMKGTGVELFLH